jgi:hypothetical protein
MLNSRGDISNFKAADAAAAKAANPEADDANPAPRGKLFLLVTLARVFMSARSRKISKNLEILGTYSGRLSPSRLSSSAERFSSKETTVSEQSASSVIDIEPTAGIFILESALPQYLIKAILALAVAFDC